MSIPSSANRGHFWRRVRFIGVLIVVAAWSLHMATDVIETLERRFDANAGSVQWPWQRDIAPGKRAVVPLSARFPATSEQTTTMPVLLSNRGPIAITGKARGAITTTTEPGYDSGQQLHAGEVDVFAKSAIFSWPAGTGAPSGDDKTDPEVATPGHL